MSRSRYAKNAVESAMLTGTYVPSRRAHVWHLLGGQPGDRAGAVRVSGAALPPLPASEFEFVLLDARGTEPSAHPGDTLRSHANEKRP